MRTFLATCTTRLIAGAGNDFRLIPAGAFRSVDGRPVECAAYVMTDEDGLRLVEDAAARTSPMVIDYEHATLHAKKGGSKAPAAGWFKTLEWRHGDGLWAIAVDWTALAAQDIASKAYRFISPVFSYDLKSGRVQKLFHAALTNDPGLDGLTDLAALTRRLAGNATGAEIARAALAYQEAMADTGVNVSTVQAVAHVAPLASVASTAPQFATGKPNEIASAALVYQEKMSDLGVYVTTVQAVAHVSKKLN